MNQYLIYTNGIKFKASSSLVVFCVAHIVMHEKYKQDFLVSTDKRRSQFFDSCASGISDIIAHFENDTGSGELLIVISLPLLYFEFRGFFFQVI